jgi:hypothetical protein
MIRLPARAAAPALTVLALAVLPSVAFGQATRTWVSGTGDDANPCSRTAPCKTFAGAISKTAAGGEINVIDPGGFGAVTITKSIEIRALGATAGVLVSGTNAIVVQAGVNDRVTLAGLDINGLGTGLNGVRILSGKEVRIEDSQIYGFTTAGISFTPSTANAHLVVQDTIINDNTAAAGIATLPTAAGGAVTVNNSHIDDNAYGVVTNGTTAQPSIVNLFHSVVSDNATAGLFSFGGVNADIRIGSNDITSNTTGLSASGGGKITSFGNNQIVGNGTDGSPTNTVVTH